MEQHLRWQIRNHVMVFAAGAFVGSFSPLLLVPVASALGLSTVNEEQSILRYGGTALLLICLFFGTLVFSIGAAIAKRFLHEPALWSSAAVGFIYSAVVFMAAIFILMARGSVGGIFFAVWLILFPGLAVAASSKFVKRSNHPLESDAREAGAR